MVYRICFYKDYGVLMYQHNWTDEDAVQYFPRIISPARFAKKNQTGPSH